MDLLDDLKPGLRYRTAAEIRAIPNGQWEQWLRAGTLPFAAFSASAECQKVLRAVLKATQRRLKA